MRGKAVRLPGRGTGHRPVHLGEKVEAEIHLKGLRKAKPRVVKGGHNSPIHALPSRVADAPVDQTEHERRRDDKYPENSAISIIRAPNTSVPRPPVFGFPDLPEGAVWKQGPSDTDAVFPTGSTERRPLPKTPRSSPRLGQIRVKLPMSTPTTGKDFHLPSPGT